MYFILVILLLIALFVVLSRSKLLIMGYQLKRLSKKIDKCKNNDKKSKLVEKYNKIANMFVSSLGIVLDKFSKGDNDYVDYL